MPLFFWGLFAGLLAGLAVAGVMGAGWYRRYERLQHRARQAERLAELGTLTGGLAHEIRNPLSTIQLNLQLFREDLRDVPGTSRLVGRLETVQKEASRLRDILDDFMRYAGKIELSRSRVDVYTLLEELVDFYTPQAQLQRVRLRVRRAERPIVASLDERLVKQAVLNLMINALQAMPGEGGEIMLAAREEAGRLIIDVTDTGKGIGPEALARIFDAYYSTRRGGTGLGLAISRRIVDEHGGHVSVSSEPGKGSVFTLEFPMEGAFQ
ncbi:MAG TPA: ATP-binding protein [Tepidisphaeraceae bacterium]|nr:ATP-binding protein [Tepidisphaeraceae bacterium]